MALPSSGRIKLSDVNTELGLSSTTRISLGQLSVLTLFNISGGRIALAADGYGKANRVSLSTTFSSNTTQTTVTASSLSGYVAGKTDLTITVNSGVYLYSTDTAAPALTITGATTGDTITLVNNGYIMGKGGDSVHSYGTRRNDGRPGGPAISISYPLIITNNSYIGGGGGGGASAGYYVPGAGGGAGGGNGSAGYSLAVGGLGGDPGQAGQNGKMTYFWDGGGGGRIMPGVGGVFHRGGTSDGGGGGGGAGGASAGRAQGGYAAATNGGSAGDSTPSVDYRYDIPGWNWQVYGYGEVGTGGGGWGASAGSANSGSYGTAIGGTGGKGIQLNGNTVTYVVQGTIYGAVS